LLILLGPCGLHHVGRVRVTGHPCRLAKLGLLLGDFQPELPAAQLALGLLKLLHRVLVEELVFLQPLVALCDLQLEALAAYIDRQTRGRAS
jgi:hypothetical protein